MGLNLYMFKMAKINENAWKNYRNRWVYLRGKKIKLRKYLYVSANLMHYKKRKGWEKVNHVQNYKNALNIYGFAGVKIYEDLFFKGIPLPENRSLGVRIGLYFAPAFAVFMVVLNKILKR